jgi:hypothetical protein
LLACTSDQSINRQYDGEIDRRADYHEGNDRIDEVTDQKLTALSSNAMAEKSGCLTIAAISGARRSLTKEATTVPNAAPTQPYQPRCHATKIA